MEQFAIKARRRENLGTGAARQYRRDGLVPAVVYGHGQEPLSIVVDEKELQGFLRHHANIAMLTVEGATVDDNLGALLKETQRDPLSRDIISVDFQWVSMTEVVHLVVPVHLVGEAPGVKLEGGTLEQTLHEVSISCLPNAIPEAIEVDISALATGRGLHVRDLAIPEGITILTSADESVAVITKGIRAEDLEVQAGEELPGEGEEGVGEKE